MEEKRIMLSQEKLNLVALICGVMCGLAAVIGLYCLATVAGELWHPVTLTWMGVIAVNSVSLLAVIILRDCYGYYDVRDWNLLDYLMVTVVVVAILGWPTGVLVAIKEYGMFPWQSLLIIDICGRVNGVIWLVLALNVSYDIMMWHRLNSSDRLCDNFDQYVARVMNR